MSQLNGKQINVPSLAPLLAGQGITSGIVHGVQNGMPLDAAIFDTLSIDPDSSLPLLQDCECTYEDNGEICNICRGAQMVPTEMGKSILTFFKVVEYLKFAGGKL